MLGQAMSISAFNMDLLRKQVSDSALDATGLRDPYRSGANGEPAHPEVNLLAIVLSWKWLGTDFEGAVVVALSE